MTVNSLANRLTGYEEQEARSVVRLLLSDLFGFTLTDICCGALDGMTAEQKASLEAAMERLEKGEPVQYVTGKAEFRGREYRVGEGVLIPRPETEELLDLLSGKITQEGQSPLCKNALDIGTGSGCIAISMALEHPDWDVTAWDISEKALNIAKENAERLGAKVRFEKRDILKFTQGGLSPMCKNKDKITQEGQSPMCKKWDVIVSNPPYICNKERVDMERQVLDFEPHEALFVPDDDPLLFYRAIAKYAAEMLNEGGLLAFEINPLYANELISLLNSLTPSLSNSNTPSLFHSVTLHQDQFGKERFVLARKKSLVP